ncbi:tagaturonate reductase [Alkalibacter saccharofermentans]|uniref:Altronate oxidoreductase n=1 Tax=Alkalibacter saccharofermentans DSM 14828 TaxID=1120975 RepID=A0A1M4W553_9FIRM|nr:tagaturonate reductase [Alkalibacter saccharofermentans]SHE76280.1 tagaturonate reductase [Alkalibacter saccharofermentans DSM 14828]
MNLNKNTYKNYKSYPEKVIQFGEGNFLRAFVDWQIDKLNKEADFNSGVVVVQPIDKGLVELLNEQDGLYTLYLNGIKDGEASREHSVINCITRAINPYTQNDEYLALAHNPEMRFIISNTTEAGISFEENDKLEDKPQNSFPGKLTALLYERFKYFNGDDDKGFIIIPCELIDKNGEKLKETVIKYVELWELEEKFKKWIVEANTFCNSLVDRIVPGYPRERINEIQEELGYQDKLVVEGEPFHLWVIEAPERIAEEFPAASIGLNTLFVKDMAPYRTRKVRILNGAHTSMVPVSYLYGIDTVRESVEDQVIGNYVKQTIFDEIIPTLDLPLEELEKFAADVLDRFKNPYIKHELMSISLNSISKFETRVLPSILEYQKRKNELPRRLVFSLAALIIFYKGERNGDEIALNDDANILEGFKNVWASYEQQKITIEDLVEEVLKNKTIWKNDIDKIEGLPSLVAVYVEDILKNGMNEATKGVLK